jgi:Gram-negative bacterial TonB protein C-terminal
MSVKRARNNSVLWASALAVVIVMVAAWLLHAILIMTRATQPVAREIQFGGQALRHLAKAKVLPSYTPDSITQHHTGVAVAEIAVNGRTGAVTAVQVLQSPDHATGTAVAAALRKWRFRPVTVRHKPVNFAGRLIFYFEIMHGKGVVLNPDQMRETLLQRQAHVR